MPHIQKLISSGGWRTGQKVKIEMPEDDSSLEGEISEVFGNDLVLAKFESMLM
jgi:hypothetical protein